MLWSHPFVPLALVYCFIPTPCALYFYLLVRVLFICRFVCSSSHLHPDVKESMMSFPHHAHSGIVEAARDLFMQIEGEYTFAVFPLETHWVVWCWSVTLQLLFRVLICFLIISSVVVLWIIDCLWFHDSFWLYLSKFGSCDLVS